MTTTKHIAVERIINAAIDGGYEKAKECCVYSNHYECRDIETILLDTTFWECAGKSLGWESYCSGNVFIATWRKLLKDQSGVGTVPYWQYKWHTFIDYLANGHDINSALEKIL
jgi:hypothetical protein